MGGFFKRMVAGGFDAFKTASAKKSVYEAHNEKRDANIDAAAKVTGSEAEWLAVRIGRDGSLDDNERKLVERMRELEKDLPATLKALIDRAA